MKKLMILVLTLMCFATFFSGCTGINAGVAANVATDTAFVMALQNNPDYKPAVVSGLQGMKTFLSGKVTYDDLILQITKQFGGKYAYVGVILSGYVAADKPIFETYLPMLDSYKAAVTAKIDRFLLLAGAT